MTEHQIERKLREDTRYEIISKTLTDPEWTAERAAEVLHLTVRQVFRLKARIQAHGRDGLIHGNLGRKPAVALPDRLHQRVVGIYDESYRIPGYNYSHFTEALAEDYQITISRETVRQWLREAELGHQPRHYRAHRRRRERRARLGQMLFLDGSPHPWFGPDYPRVTLILATDDATSAPLYGCFRAHEDRNGCFDVMYHVALTWGLPDTLYLDKGSVFKTTRHGGIHAHQESDDLTAFQIAMGRLGVEIIYAHTPQARGRGERMNGSLQGRLVPELRLHKIAALEPATHYLNEHFIPRYVKRFAVEPRDPNPAFRPIPAGLDLRRVLCKSSSRRVHSDNTVRLNGRAYQLYAPDTYPGLYGSEVTVEEWFDGSVHIYYKTLGEVKNRLIPVSEIYRLRNNCTRRHHDKITLP